MIEPPPALIRWGTPWRQHRNGPSRLSAMVRSHTPRSISCTGTSSTNEPPAQFMITSILTKLASPPASRSCFSVACPNSRLISASATLAPSRANINAVAFAIPEPAPVMNATLPSSLPIFFLLSDKRHPAFFHFKHYATLLPLQALSYLDSGAFG